MRRVAVLVALLTVVLTGCNVTDQFEGDVDNLGKQIVADWKQHPAVTDAGYWYGHGLDYGQHLEIWATVEKDSLSDAVTSQLVEAGTRAYWLAPVGSVDLRVFLFSSEDPPAPGEAGARLREKEAAVHTVKIEFDNDDPEQVEELNAKYGPPGKP